jgi:hypothetical protein
MVRGALYAPSQHGAAAMQRWVLIALKTGMFEESDDEEHEHDRTLHSCLHASRSGEIRT